MGAKEFTFGFVISSVLANGFGNSFKTADSYMELLRNKTSQYDKILTKCKDSFAKNVISADAYNNAISKIRPEMDKLIQKQAQYKEANDKASKALGNFGKYMATVAGVRWGLYNGPIQSSMQFESAMADVRKVVDFDTPQQFQEMSQDILEMSKNIPMTAEGLGKIVAAGGQAGIAKDDLLSFAEAAAKMGVAFDITADQAGDMMAKWRTAFKMNQSEVVDLADKVNYLGNTTAASAPIISDIITRVGPLGEVGGVASGEIAALGASLAGSGIESDVAATGIKNMILALVSGESATKSQADAFASLGMDAGEMAQRMQTDAKGAILDVLRSIQSLDKAQQATTLKNLFGMESLGAIAPLLSNLDGLEENFNKVGDASNYAGSMQNEFNTRSGTTANGLFRALFIYIGPADLARAAFHAGNWGEWQISAFCPAFFLSHELTHPMGWI